MSLKKQTTVTQKFLPQILDNRFYFPSPINNNAALKQRSLQI